MAFRWRDCRGHTNRVMKMVIMLPSKATGGAQEVMGSECRDSSGYGAVSWPSVWSNMIGPPDAWGGKIVSPAKRRSNPIRLRLLAQGRRTSRPPNDHWHSGRGTMPHPCYYPGKGCSAAPLTQWWPRQGTTVFQAVPNHLPSAAHKHTLIRTIGRACLWRMDSQLVIMKSVSGG